MDRLADGSLDATFVSGPVPDEGRGLRVVPLWRDELVAAVPARHLVARPNTRPSPPSRGWACASPSGATHPALVDLVVGAFHAAGCEPASSSPHTNLRETLAAIGTDGASSYTIMYAAHAAQLRNRRVAFVPFEPPGLGLTAHLVARRSTPTPHFSLLMQDCDHDS